MEEEFGYLDYTSTVKRKWYVQCANRAMASTDSQFVDGEERLLKRFQMRPDAFMISASLKRAGDVCVIVEAKEGVPPHNIMALLNSATDNLPYTISGCSLVFGRGTNFRAPTNKDQIQRTHAKASA